MSTKTQITEQSSTAIIKGRNVKAITYSDGTWTDSLIVLRGGSLGRSCWKCGGVGYLSGYEFSDNARCWSCNASGISYVYGDAKKALESVKRSLAKTRKNAQIAAEQRRIAEETKAAREAAWSLWISENQDVHDYVMASTVDDNRFVDEMFDALRNQRPMTDAQTAAVRKLMADQDAQRFYGTEGDKVTVTGRIVKTFSGYSDYGVYYMVVIEGIDTFQGATFKLSGTSKMVIDLQDCEGDIVTVQATVKQHSVYKGTKQTVLLRPKLISQEMPVTAEQEIMMESGEPQWAGTVEVQYADRDAYDVYPVNGTYDAWELLNDLHAAKRICYAVLSFYGCEWNTMSFNGSELERSRHGMAGLDSKLGSLLDRDNTHYKVTGYKRGDKPMCRRSIEEMNLLREWRKAFGQLQWHVQERGQGTHHACQVSGVQRWGCPEWQQMNKPVEELEERMRELGMAPPYAVLECAKQR